MLNVYRESYSAKSQSYRRTLLCYSTLCLFLFLIIFLLLTQVFNYSYVYSNNDSNKSISLNIIKFRSSLIQCGQSVIDQENIYHTIEQTRDIIKNIATIQKNIKTININEQLDFLLMKKELLIWLEHILAKCFQARQFSIIEQQTPNIIRQIISILKTELLYIIGFFVKEN